MENKFNALLHRTSEIFHRYGIRAVSMDDLSRRLGISKKTLYAYVRNKEELVEKAMMSRHQEDVERIARIQEEGGNAIDFLLALSKQVCSNLTDLNPAVVHDLKKYHPLVLEKLTHFHRDYYARLFTANLVEGIRQGLYRPDIDKELTITSYLLNMEKFFGEEIASGKHQDLTQVLRVIFGNHIRAIASVQGLAYFEKREQLMDYHFEAE